MARINFSTGYVLFKRDPVERADLRGGQRLQVIQVFENGNPVPIKEFELGASYTQSPSESLSATNYSRDATDHLYAGKRLQLDQIVERSNNLAKPPYRFTYNATKLPVKTSFQRDHWGYFNGQKTNSSLIPDYNGPAYGISNDFISVHSANREPNPQTVMASMLETIQYPTGGTTHFDYEANEYGSLHDDEFYSNYPRSVEATHSAIGIQTTPNTSSVVVPFTVVATHAEASLSLQLYGESLATGFEPARCYVIVRKKDRSYQQVYNYAEFGPGTTANGTVGKELFLDPGEYELEACAYPGNGAVAQVPPQRLYVRGLLTWMERVKDTYKKTGPGVRVAKITDYDAVDSTRNMVREYHYETTVEDNGPHPSSTGILMNRPIYWRYKEKNYVTSSPCPRSPSGEVEPCGIPETYDLCRGFQLCSYSNMQLQNSAQGSPIGYSRVEEWRGQRGSGGKTVYEYANAEDLVVPDHTLPGLPQASNPLNGYPISKTIYAAQAQSFVKRSETRTSHAIVNQQLISGVVKELEQADFHPIPGTFADAWCVMPIHTYFLRSQWIQLQQQTDRLYDPQDETKFYETTTDYTYDEQQTGHMQLSRTATKRSDGSMLMTHTEVVG